jgi:hypothetical protein
VGNGKLLAWTTANVMISVVIIADRHSRPLVIVIDLVALVQDNEKRVFTIHRWRKPTKTPWKLKQSRRMSGGAAFSRAREL